MIVAATPAAPPAEPAQGSLETSSAGQDLAAAADGKLSFGVRLRQCIGGPVAPADPRSIPGAGDEPATDATNTGVASAFPTEVIICTAAQPAPDDAAPIASGKDGDAGTTDAGADLAAQLALVSQWIGIAPTPVSDASQPSRQPASDDAGPAKVADPLGITDQLAALRSDVARTIGVSDGRVATVAGSTAASVKEASTILPTKTDTAVRESDRAVSTAAATTPAFAASLFSTMATKDAVERTVAALDPTSATSNASLAATLLHPAATALDPTVATTPTALRETVGTAAWAEEFGRAAVHVATTSLKEASLRLNPEHLGPLDVRVRIDDGVAHLNFQAAHVDTRHALEASRPLLDQLFSNQGLSIGDYSVDDQRSGSGSARDPATTADASPGDSGRRSSGGAPTKDDIALERVVAARLAKPIGLVDTFA